MTAPAHLPPSTGAARVRMWAQRLGFAAGESPAGPAPAEPRARSKAAPLSSPAVPRPTTGERLRAWAELLRIPAVFTVPGDALAGAAAAGVAPRGRTALAVGASLCLYEAGMALNDWADRDEDAVERPHRPLPSGRIRPEAALAAAGVLTAAGLALAARAGRGAFAVAVPLAASVWAYDLKLKHTEAGPAAMAAARSLDLLLGAAAAAGSVRPALAPAAVLGGHTYAVTVVSRRETEGGSTAAPLAALAATGLLSAALARRPAAAAGDASGRGARRGWLAAGDDLGRRARRDAAAAGEDSGRGVLRGAVAAGGDSGWRARSAAVAPDAVRVAMAAGYALTFARPLLHAALNPSPALTQRAVGGGIRAMMPLQGGLMARAGAPGSAILTVAFAPLAARLARKVSCT